MPPIRSVLWIGRGDRFAGDLVADAPTLDVRWEHDLAGAAREPDAPVDAVLLDADDARAALRDLARRSGALARPPWLVRIGAGEAEAAAALRAAGAADVLLRGSGGDADVVARIEDALAGGRRGRDAARSPFPSIVGRSRAMGDVFALVERAAGSPATVLLTGETGTGKELFARAIHDRSVRRGRRFLALNCAAFPEALLESELFGHAKGAFTGADRDKTGLVEAADRGTLLLDEFTETSGPFQAKLLRVLQEREVRPVGSARAKTVDVRVVAASNRDPWHEVQQGRLREDLYYRLAVFPIHVPPLRQRSGDVALLAEFFLARLGGCEGGGVSLSPEARELLESHTWPGNVRELENEVQRALALAGPGEPLRPEHFSARVRDGADALAAARPGETLKQSLGRIEAVLIRRALTAHGEQRTATARALGITREGLYKKMKRLGIE